MAEVPNLKQWMRRNGSTNAQGGVHPFTMTTLFPNTPEPQVYTFVPGGMDFMFIYDGRQTAWLQAKITELQAEHPDADERDIAEMTFADYAKEVQFDPSVAILLLMNRIVTLENAADPDGSVS